VNSVYDSRILNLVIFSPLVIAGLLLFLPRGEKKQIRLLTLLGMVGNFAACAWAWARFQPKSPVEFQLEYRLEWLSDIGLSGTTWASTACRWRWCC
jgi:NADH:ubiquinone oxidoreductase subunit 4 (subunit M)